MKRLRNILVSVLLCLFLFIPMFADATVLYVASKTVKLGWDDDQTDIASYELVLIRDKTGVQYGPYVTTTKTIEITRPKSGIYEVRVRGLRAGQYSLSHSSIDDNAILKTGVKGKWKVFFKLTGPTGPLIID